MYEGIRTAYKISVGKPEEKIPTQIILKWSLQK
jgi:hypothetical protein